DCAVAWQYEKRMRPEEKWHQPWLDLQWTKITDGLRVIEKELPEMGDKADIKAMALAATLGYLALRFDGVWEADFPKLVEWAAKFDTVHPDIAQYKPSA
ncbi:glutathione S-transferase, partial [Ahrensia sp. AH-315-G08]|nr:glutathione S-transferase [Ahrensia sp. AH-315-G08]